MDITPLDYYKKERSIKLRKFLMVVFKLTLFFMALSWGLSRLLVILSDVNIVH